MTTQEVLRTGGKGHVGYQPMAIWEHASAPICWSVAIKLKTVPGKITAFFRKELIAEVRKLTGGPAGAAGTYYLKLVDATWLEVDY